MSTEPGDLAEELKFWRSLAEERGKVIRALHEFNYWHESTVSRGEVIAGLEQSVAMWRDRCLASEANADAVADLELRPRHPVAPPLWRRVVGRLRRSVTSLGHRLRPGTP